MRLFQNKKAKAAKALDEGLLYFENNDFLSAYFTFSAATEFDPKNVRALYYTGITVLELQNLVFRHNL